MLQSWHSLKTKTFSISLPIDRVILQLHSLDAPIPVLNFFLSHLADARRRLWLARKVGALKSVTDSLVELKDRQGLDDFVQSIAPGTESRFYADSALRNLVKSCTHYIRIDSFHTFNFSGANGIQII